MNSQTKTATGGDSDVRYLPSVCALDCPDTCALKIGVRDGRVVTLGGDPDHANTRGFACVKTARYPDRQQHPDRLHYPMRRVRPKDPHADPASIRDPSVFARCTWDEALDAIAGRLSEVLDQYGGRAVLPFCYGGTLGKIQGDHPLGFFRAIGAIEQDMTMCAATGEAGWQRAYGPRKLSTDPADVPHAGTILLWGINAARSHSHLMPWVKSARKNGGRVYHIDPYHNETSRAADVAMQIRVGTDAALALAIGGELIRRDAIDRDYITRHALGFESYVRSCSDWPIDRAAEYCGLSSDSIIALVDRIESHGPLYIRVGYGMTRNEGGGNAIHAIALLPALTGAWRHRGGGGGISSSGAFDWGGRTTVPSDRRRVSQIELGRELNRRDDPIYAMVVFNSNPAAVTPDSAAVRRGLSRSDLFTVVLDHFRTDTADYADFVLPATTFLEHADLYGAYGHLDVQWAEPVVPPPGQCKPNTWVFAELGRRLGIDDASIFASTDQIAESFLDGGPSLDGITLERLKRHRHLRLNLPEPFRPYADGSHHHDGKIRFGDPPPMQIEFDERLTDEYPLRLISPPGSHSINTTMGNVDALRKARGGEPSIMMHPDDARDLRDGQLVTVRSRVGTIRRRLVVSTDARAGTVVAVGLWWPRDCGDWRGLNELTSDRKTDLGGGSTYGNIAVAVEAADASSVETAEPTGVEAAGPPDVSTA